MTPAQALDLARAAHRGQTDKQGRDYVEAHLLPIAALLAPFGEQAEVAGLLHDAVEDTDLTLERLAALGVPPAVVAAVDAVTKRPGEPYEGLVARAAADPLGRLVKLADNWHNLSSLDALAEDDPATADRLRRKYAAARAVLTASLTRG